MLIGTYRLLSTVLTFLFLIIVYPRSFSFSLLLSYLAFSLHNGIFSHLSFSGINIFPTLFRLNSLYTLIKGCLFYLLACPNHFPRNSSKSIPYRNCNQKVDAFAVIFRFIFSVFIVHHFLFSHRYRTGSSYLSIYSIFR